jgi:hypothetical protein
MIIIQLYLIEVQLIECRKKEVPENKPIVPSHCKRQSRIHETLGQLNVATRDG